MTTTPTRRRTPYGKVYSLLDSDEPAVVRYSGDPDEFTALAHAWLSEEHGLFYDHPIALLPPEPRWFRMNAVQSDEYGWTLGFPSGPGRGNWLGSFLRVVQIGCSQCRYLHGAHHPGGCLNADIIAFQTCQLIPEPCPGYGERSRRQAKSMIHLVRMRATGTPGPTLCGVDRFSPAVSFHMGGGHTEGTDTLRGCWACVRSARNEFPGLAVHTSLREFAQLFVNDGLPVGKQWSALTPMPGTAGARALAGT